MLGMAESSSPGQAQRGEMQFPSVSLPEIGVSTQKQNARRVKFFMPLLQQGSGMEPLGAKAF